MAKKLLAEFIATFLLLFCGLGAIIIYHETGAPAHAGICAVWGAVVLSLIYGFGEVSGCHINPAVTIAFWVAGRFPAKEIGPYVIAQAAGAFACVLLLKYLFPADPTLGATLPHNGEYMQSFIIEVVLMFFLMLVVLNVSTGAKEKGITAAMAIGSVVGLEAMFAGPITGASMNPIRSIAPAIVSGHTEHLWVYIAAPLLGALLAVGAHNLMYKEA